MKHLLLLGTMLGLAVAQEPAPAVVTYTAKVYVEGMQCPVTCGETLTGAFEMLEGVKSVELSDFGAGEFTLAVEEKALLTPSKVKKACGTFELVRLTVSLVGTAIESEGFVSLTARESGMAVALKGGGDDGCCEHVENAALATVKRLIKEGKTLVKAEGTLKEVEAGDKTTKLVLDLASAEAVEEKK